jgi:hypothetical protein
MTRTCMDCPTELGARNLTGRCKSCATRHNNADPVAAEKRRQGIARRFADPEYRAAHAARCASMNRHISPEVREQRRQHGHRMTATLRAANDKITKDQRMAAGAARSATVLAWCPPEWREKYRDLKRGGRPAADAKRLVLDLIAGKPMPTPYAKQRAALNWCPPARALSTLARGPPWVPPRPAASSRQT